MEVVALNGSSSSAPFRREVHEWQMVHAKTGATLSGRAEANRYVNGNLNTYGKSLLQSFETSDGTQHKQHKQMNILQTITSTGGALQVVRAQTIQTSHSSSRRAITSTTYSSHYTNGGSATVAPNTMNGDLLSISPRASSLHHQHEFQQQHSSPPSSSRLKALLSSAAAASEGNSKTHLFHQTNNDKSNNSHDTVDPAMKNGVGSSIQEFSRKQQMNEMLFGSSTEESFKSSNSFLRGKSASIEELANIINDSDNEDDVKPYDWKRVSKIRRSLQFPKTSTERRINFSRPSRPADLPENCVNVWKLRQDIENLENERRQIGNGAMKTAILNNGNSTNGNINFVALDSILKESSPLDSLNSNHSNGRERGVADETAKDDQKADCVTAESLQEIRRRLRKLNVTNSNDFIPSSTKLLTVDENSNNHLLQKSTVEQNCKSLELRKNKERDITADDWSNRRKSYGFEKMFQPCEAPTSSSLGGIGIESSTDSGLGRSSDLPSNWSPTIDSPQRTIITFGDNKTKPTTTSISLFSNPHHAKSEINGNESKAAKPIPMRRSSTERKEEIKRHSIAIDEKVDEHYQQRTGIGGSGGNSSNDRKISLVNLNGPYFSADKLPQLPLAVTAAINSSSSSNNMLLNDGRQKKVEFCKTEIHFAAESGRVNIVETDEKPPPTNNFRRRRRNSGTSLQQQEYSTQQQQIDFDDENEKHLAGEANENDDDDDDDVANGGAESNVTTTIGSVYSSAREDETDEGHSDTDGLRGILKNKPIKPKPYHLGENLESGSSLWGVRLKPVENQHTTWRHSSDIESVMAGGKKTTGEDALEDEFRNLVKAINEGDNNSDQYQSSVSSNGYSTKINLSSLPTIQQHPAKTNNGNNNNSNKDYSSTTTMLAASHKPTTFTSFNDSRQSSGNVALPDDKNQTRYREKEEGGGGGVGHKISIDLKLPHPSSMDVIMDELKSTSLIIKTMKSTSYFDDAMKQFEQESPLIRTSSLRLNNESLPKSSSTSMMFNRYKPNAPVRYTSSLDGDHGILEDNQSTEKRNDDFDFLNGFLEENRKFQVSIAQKEKQSSKTIIAPSVSLPITTAPSHSHQQPPVAAPRLKKIMNPSQQLSQQLSQLKHLYDIANYDSDDNAKADEEVKSFLSKNEEEKSISELSGSWSRVRVKKIASAFQSSSSSATATATTANKWTKTPLTSLYENATTSATAGASKVATAIEPTPRTSLIQIGSNHDEKVNSNNDNDSSNHTSGSTYSNINSIQQDNNSVKVSIQNFESLSPALSRNNSLRIKKDTAKDDAQKISTGTRKLKAHELTYFGVKSSPGTTTTTNATETNAITTNKSPFMHLATNNKTSSSIKTTTTATKITTNNNNNKNTTAVSISHQKPDLIMHHQQKHEQHQKQRQQRHSSKPELTSSEKKLMIEALDSCIDETNNLEPLYENLYQSNNRQQYDRKLDLARDEKILDELARAADEIMNTCKEMYHADSEEKRRKSLLLTSTSTCLETINEGAEGRQQKLHHQHGEVEQPKLMKSKGVQVSRNFEDSLRRYNRMQQRTSSQSSIESLPRNSKVSSSSSVVTARSKRVKNGESAASTASTTISSTASSRKRENGNSSGDASKRIHRVCSRERMQKSNASSSESDLPNSSVEVPRRPRRTKLVKHRDESGRSDEKKSSRTATAEASSGSSKKRLEHSSSMSKETRTRSSAVSKSSSSVNPNTHSHRLNGGSATTSIPTSSSRKSRR